MTTSRSLVGYVGVYVPLESIVMMSFESLKKEVQRGREARSFASRTGCNAEFPTKAAQFEITLSVTVEQFPSGPALTD